MKKKKDLVWGWVDDNHISILWNIDDVKRQAEISGLKLTRQECRDVLDACLDGHDANIGISWDILDYHICNLFGERIKKTA